MRRYRGVSALSNNSILSRDGSAKLYDLNAHSVTYFDGQWYSGVSTSIYRAAVEIVTGLSGDRLSFAVMAPVAGIDDYLFVAGGGELIKIDTNGNDTNWGLAPPGTGPVLADGGAGGSLDDGAVYKYAVTFKNSVTGHRSNSNNLTNLAITSDYKSLLHFEGSHGSSTITQAISGGPAFTATANAVITTSDYKFGSACLDIPSSSGDVIAAADSADWYFTGDFTISFWYKLKTGETKCLFGQYEDSSNYMRYRYTYGSVNTTHNFEVIASSATIVELEASVSTKNQWQNIVITRSTNDWYLFIDGVLVDSDTNANAYPDLGAIFTIGRGYDEDTPGNIFGKGYYDEFLIVKGTALYTEAFEPEVGAFGGNEIDLAGGSTSIDLSSIPQPFDNQADQIEIWRTVGGGSAYFKLVSLATGTTTYTDNIADGSLLSTELPTDNTKPYSFFDDCFGPWNGSMFWITRSEDGEKGRLYYSAIGRAETMESFIEVSSNDDGLQKILSYAGNLFVLSKSKAFQIYGNNPYFSREVPGVPGTVLPHTVVVTPIGPMWESQDGVRVFFGGSQAQLIAYDQVKAIFRGRTVENIASFTGVVATYARGEYIISNGTATIALDLEKKTWRDLGVGANALAYSPSTDQIALVTNEDILDFEKEGTTQDAAVDITFDILTPTITLVPPASIEMIRVDANANTETLACNAYLDDAAVSQGNLTTTAGRRYTEFDVDARLTNRIAVRLNGSIDAGVEVHSIEITGWPMVLYLFLNDKVREIPGRLAGDRQSLIFESFSDTQDSLQSTYIMERLFYDFNTADETITVTLRVIGKTGTEANVALGTIDTTVRTASEININKEGRFIRLTLAGAFTSAVKLRRLELVCSKRR
jgi:hypothetical protein